MARFNSYLITWADEGLAVPSSQRIDRLAETARANSGRLLALGPVHDSSEQSSRAVPSWVAVAGFADEQHATEWFDDCETQLAGTTILAPALREPAWWPSEFAAARPDWSLHLDLDPPMERSGVFVTVWADIADPAVFLDYAAHFKWTVEYDGGVGLASGPSPKVLGGDSGPNAIALMSWPADEVARHAWYNGAHYRPYKQQRHRSSNSTIVSVTALPSSSSEAAAPSR